MFSMSKNNVMIMIVVAVVLYYLYRGGMEGFAMTPYYNNWDVLAQDVFSLDRRIDAVPDESFVKQFEDSRHVSCAKPDDWRVRQYCRGDAM